MTTKIKIGSILAVCFIASVGHINAHVLGACHRNQTQPLCTTTNRIYKLQGRQVHSCF